MGWLNMRFEALTKQQRVIARTKHLAKWHKWFAWFPVKVLNQWVWLEYVERKIAWASSYRGKIYWVYRNGETND